MSQTRTTLTRAAAALADRFAQRHGEQRDCAAACKIPQHRLSRLASGKLFPRADESHRIEQAIGIPTGWWAEPAKAPIPPERDVARTDPKFDGGRSEHPPWAPEDADSNPSGTSKPEAGNAA